MQCYFLYPSRLPFKFYFVFKWQVKGAYLCLAEVKRVKTGVPRLFGMVFTCGIFIHGKGLGVG